MISFDIIRSREQIANYYADWERLFASGEYEPSVSVAWTEALLKSHLDAHTPALIVLRDSSQIVGLVPLYLTHVKKAGFRLLTVFPVAEHFNTHSELLLRDLSQDLVASLLQAIFSCYPHWDVIRINRLVHNQPLLTILEQVLKEHFSYKYQIDSAEPSLFIKFGTTYDQYLRTRSKNLRYRIRHASETMHSLGEISILRERDYSTFESIRDQIFAIEEASWKHKNGTGISSTEHQRRFYGELCGRYFTQGQLRVWLLCANGKPLAFEMGLVHQKRYYSVHGSYDEAFKKMSLGTVLLARSISDLMDEGIEELDFFGEPFEGQQHWTSDYREHKALLVYNNNFAGKLFYVFNLLRNRLATHSRSGLVLRKPRAAS